jgi:hypothetical protein
MRAGWATKKAATWATWPATITTSVSRTFRKPGIPQLRRLNQKSYRFSISWARFPGRGFCPTEPVRRTRMGLDHDKRVMQVRIG